MKIVTDISTTAMLRRARGNWDPGAIFRSPLQGAWFDPSDVTTLFQDSAATVPVAGDGDPVGRMLDKSGNGNDAVQSNAARRPKWRTDGTLSWIEFDGVDDRMETAITVLDGAPVMTSCAGLSYLPGGAAWGALRSLVDVGIYVGLSHPSITGAVSNVGGAFFLNGVPAPNDRKALREALVAPAVFEGQDIQIASFSGQKWQVFSYWNTSPPGGRLFGYVDYVGTAGPERTQLRLWMARQTGVTL